MTDPSSRGRHPASRWRPTVAHVRACLAVVPITLALVWPRPDLLVLATPLAIVAGWSLVARPRAAPKLHDRVDHRTIREGDATNWRGTVSVEADTDIDLAVAVVGRHPFFRQRPSSGAVTAAPVSGRAELTIALRATRWGKRDTEPIRIVAAGPWGAFRWDAQAPGYRVTVLPVPGAFDADTVAAPASGLVGVHRSARPGEGSEFAGVRPFHIGDRVRHVNWPRSLRSGELHVNTRWADRDTHVALIVDATADVGVSEGIDAGASSLDTTVRAAGAIAEHFTRHGDRVSLRVLTNTAHHTPTLVPPGTGTAHLRRLLEVLALVPPVEADEFGRQPSRQPFTLPGDVLAILLSPLVTAHVLDRAVALGRRGISAAVLDTLPEQLTSSNDAYAALAWRIRLLERQREINLVQQAGVAVIDWRGPGSLDQFLRDVTRRASTPHLVRR